MKKTKKPISVLRWIGVFFLMMFAIVFFSYGGSGIIGGLIFIFLAFLCSPFGHYLADRFPEKARSLPIRIVGAVVAFFIACATIPSSEVTKDAENAEVRLVDAAQEESLDGQDMTRGPIIVDDTEDDAVDAEEQKRLEEEAKEAAAEEERKAAEEKAAAEKKAAEEKAAAEKKAAEEKAAAEKKAAEEKAAEEKKAAEKATVAKVAEEQAKNEAEEAAAEVQAADTTRASEAQAVAETVTATTTDSGAVASGGGGGGNADNFNLYDNPEQQQTEATYVLNLSTHKFHKPSCKDVRKIKEENYGTISASRDEVIAQGYSPCGHCNP